nr:MAG TPA: hypothetical protein [Bacteriophage sp.]
MFTLLTNLYVFVSESRTYKIPLIFITHYKYYLIENRKSTLFPLYYVKTQPLSKISLSVVI